MENPLAATNTNRYERQLLLTEIGVEGQQKLKTASVLVIGAGGLGVPILQYLTAAGVGTVGIADGDVVELSNLQRQVLYSQDDAGKLKVDAAEDRLRNLNSEIEIVTHPEFISAKNALDILSRYEIIIDGSDNFPTRYLINDACVKLDKPFLSGAVTRFSGQVGVFNYKNSGTYRCLFPSPPAPGEQPDCNESGVIGVTPGLAGMMMASEVIKIICGIGSVLAGKLITLDLLTNNFKTVSFLRNEEAVIHIKSAVLKSYGGPEIFCNTASMSVKEIAPSELKKMIQAKEDFQLIDVRESFEREELNIGGDFIPFAEVISSEERIARNKQVVFYCKIGTRSHIIIQRLQDKFGLTNLYNLKGGLLGYCQ